MSRTQTNGPRTSTEAMSAQATRLDDCPRAPRMPSGPIVNSSGSGIFASVLEIRRIDNTRAMGRDANRKIAGTTRPMPSPSCPPAMSTAPQMRMRIPPVQITTGVQRGISIRLTRYASSAVRRKVTDRGAGSPAAPDRDGSIQPPAGPPPRPGSVIAAGSSSRSSSAASMPRSSASSRIVRPEAKASLASFAASS